MTVHIRRREFIVTLGGAAAALPLAVRAEQPTKMSVIACIVGGSMTAAERYFGGFSQGMRELGYTQGRDYGFEIRYAEGEQERNPLAGGRTDPSQARHSRFRDARRCDRFQKIHRFHTYCVAGAH